MDLRGKAGAALVLVGWLLACSAVWAESEGTSNGIVMVDIANVRQGAGTQHPVVGQIKRGEGVFILGQTGSWYQVRTKDGSVQGYVQFRLIRPMTVSTPSGGAIRAERVIPRFQCSPSIPIDDQYVLQRYAEAVAEALRKKVRDLSRGVEGEVNFDGASFDDLGFAFWDTPDFQMFEVIVPLTEESFLSPGTMTRVGTGYVFDPQTSGLIKNMVQLVQESFLAAEESMASDDNKRFMVRRYASATQVSYVNRRGEQISFLRPFDTSMTFFSQSFYVFLENMEDAVNENADADIIQFGLDAGGKVVELLKGAYPRGVKIR